jgi:hypothetical protein
MLRVSLTAAFLYFLAYGGFGYLRNMGSWGVTLIHRCSEARLLCIIWLAFVTSREPTDNITAVCIEINFL